MTQPSGNRNMQCCVSLFLAHHVHDYFENHGLLSGDWYSLVEMIDFTLQKLYNKKRFLGYKGFKSAVFGIWIRLHTGVLYCPLELSDLYALLLLKEGVDL